MPLTICIVAFSVCSVLSGLAASFAVLLAACLLMGIAEGPILPRLSDRIGRKPVIVATYSIGFIIPISLLTWYGSALLLAPLIFVGACVGGAMSLFMGVVPSETVPAAPGGDRCCVCNEGDRTEARGKTTGSDRAYGV